MSSVPKLYEPEDSLAGLQAKAIEEAEATEASLKGGVLHAWECGKVLKQIKKRMKGPFLQWVNSDAWGRGERCARYYMEIHSCNRQRVADCNSIREAVEIAQKEREPSNRQKVLTFIAGRPNGATPEEIFEAFPDIPNSSLSTLPSKLAKEGLIKSRGTRKPKHGVKPGKVWVIVEDDPAEQEKARKKQEKAERDEKLSKVAKTLAELKPRDRAHVLAEAREQNERMNKEAMTQIAVNQRRGDSETASEHVLQCLSDAYNAIHGADTQNGPGTDRRWMNSMDEVRKDEILHFCNSLPKHVETLCKYLKKELT